jgi:hypothetical protein
VPLQDYLRSGPWKSRRERGKKDRHWIPKRESQFQIPTGDQAVPRYDPTWDLENDKDKCTCNHFIHCILEKNKKNQDKTTNYSQVTAVQQGPLEAPVALLQRLKDALQKHTNIVLESQEKEIILKDTFLTQSQIFVEIFKCWWLKKAKI